MPFCIAPATAHTIAKMATGQADNLADGRVPGLHRARCWSRRR